MNTMNAEQDSTTTTMKAMLNKLFFLSGRIEGADHDKPHFGSEAELSRN